jgi:DNA-directed RNA polymerase subunit RPC12/RpoP
MMDNYCTCSRHPDDTFVGKWDDEQDLICCRCHKYLFWTETEDEDQSEVHMQDPQMSSDEYIYFEGAGQAKVWKNIQRGPAAFWCSHCDGLAFWQDNVKEIWDEVMEDLRTSSRIECPHCRHGIYIPDEWRVMME